MFGAERKSSVVLLTSSGLEADCTVNDATERNWRPADAPLLGQLFAVHCLHAFPWYTNDDVAEAGTQVPRGQSERLQIAFLIQRCVQRQFAARRLGDEDDLLVEVHFRDLLRDLPR